MKLFLDTNILFDFISGREPHFSSAQRLVVMKAFGDVELCVSGKSYTDIFYILKKYQGAQEIQDSFLDSLDIFTICSLEEDDLRAACKLGWPDFEDALIEISAQKMGADYLITRDLGFKDSRVTTESPEQIVKVMEGQGLSYAAIDLDSLNLD